LTGGCAVIAGVNEVGPNFGRGNTDPSASERGHDAGGDGGLANSG
jgi:hypothetical protein